MPSESQKGKDTFSRSHPLLDTVEELLYEDESSVLDFKEDQYPFGNATNEQRGELIKDVIALANSWGRADTRYILIGVREVVTGKSEVKGVNDHLPEHALQQLINSRTNRVVELSYHAVPIAGKSVGVIAIPRQQRPTFLNKAYGDLEAEVVYVRRGSSTAKAKPDEIAKMGKHESRREASLEVNLALPDTRETYLESLEKKVDCIQILSFNSIPDYECRDRFFTGILPNKDYYRDVAEYIQASKSTLRLGFFIQNKGVGAAKDVVIRMEVQPDDNYTVQANPVKEPSEREVITNPLIQHAKEQTRPYRPKVRRGACLEVKYDLGVIQPGLYVWTDPFYLIVHKPGIHKLRVEVYSAQLPSPEQYDFEVQANGTEEVIGPDEIVKIGDQALGRK